MNLLQFLHIGLTALPWGFAIWCRRAWVLLICIAVNMVVMTQWLILGNCVINRFEGDGTTTESAVMIDIAKYWQIPFQEFKDGFILINALAPSFLQISRIAGALGL
jgi:hypothetical protein